MNTYAWQTRCFQIKDTIKAKLAVKTKEVDWLGTEAPSVVLVSIHSLFHQSPDGDLKMKALMQTLKNRIKGKITILLSDAAHLHTYCLQFSQDIQSALHACAKEADRLIDRYGDSFTGCHVASWHSYICQDAAFFTALQAVKALYAEDRLFKEHVLNDIRPDFAHTWCAIEDLLTQCASHLVLAEKGYRFLFYPGKANLACEYVNRTLLAKEKRLLWINVFLSIEKKTCIK